MGIFDQSSSPLSTLIPQSSSYKMPDYSNAFKMNNQMQMNNLKFSTGLLLSDSSNSVTALNGRNMMNDAINLNQSNILPLSNNFKKSGFNWDLGFNTIQLMGSLMGGQAGTILLGTGTIGSGIRSINLANKSVKETLKNGTAADLKVAKQAKAGAIGATIGAASDLVGSFMPQKTEYSGDKGNITKTMDSVYDGISDAAMAFGPIGSLVGGVMKGGALLGKGMNALGGGTSGMTTTDAILGSSFLNLTPLGLVNGFGGKTTDTITKDNELFSLMGSSYAGSEAAVNDALTKSGKKYGAFSSGARRKANNQIHEARRLLDTISDISDEATDRFNIRNSMAAINGNRYGLGLQGGYDQSAIRIGKHGMSVDLLLRARTILKAQLGIKTLNPFLVYLLSLPENLRDSTNYRVKDYWEYNGRPKNFEEAKRKGMFVEQEDFDNSGKSLGKSWHGFTVAENPNTGELEFMKSSTHPTILKELDWYNSDDGADFRSQYELVKTEPYYKYVKRTTPTKLETPQHKNGGSIIELISETTIDLVNPLDVPEFLNGGSINVIPDGALHARKHNMDLEGITPKGIPVVSEKDNGKVEQLAEIEKEEVIFRLEVTQKLEELEKKYYSEEISLKEKDELALEAGKLITEELLHNTKDNAGLL